MDVSTTAGWQAAEASGAEAGFQGCFSDPATMQQFYFVSSLNSPDLCAETCAMKGYKLSGVTQGSTFFAMPDIDYMSVLTLSQSRQVHLWEHTAKELLAS